MYLCNKEVFLREFKEDDIDKKVEWINNPENNQYLHYDLPLQYEKTYCWYINKDNTKRCDCVIEYKGEPVGLIGLLEIDQYNKKTEFYISMGETQHKRKGIATQASCMLLEYAFNVLEMSKVYLNVDEANVAACNLYEKVGFVCEGIFRKDMIHNGRYINRKRYAILKEEYNEKYINSQCRN